MTVPVIKENKQQVKGTLYYLRFQVETMRDSALTPPEVMAYTQVIEKIDLLIHDLGIWG